MAVAWTKEAPTVGGQYWVRRVGTEHVFPWAVERESAGDLWDVAELEFGPRILPPEEMNQEAERAAGQQTRLQRLAERALKELLRAGDEPRFDTLAYWQRCQPGSEAMQLAEDAGCWFDNTGSRVALPLWLKIVAAAELSERSVAAKGNPTT